MAERLGESVTYSHRLGDWCGQIFSTDDNRPFGYKIIWQERLFEIESHTALLHSLWTANLAEACSSELAELFSVDVLEAALLASEYVEFAREFSQKMLPKVSNLKEKLCRECIFSMFITGAPGIGKTVVFKRS